MRDEAVDHLITAGDDGVLPVEGPKPIVACG